ncbi:NADH:ubiquinone oxidoreductase, subunit G, iron-sulfur binding domain protein [Candidatus Magnetoovum chiemensis]|nr:NADH:ubiquinone oxidoreductase, subunit G, iron-sulfur binding domain protein [Candidatus Magnetoovum chiemensis]
MSKLVNVKFNGKDYQVPEGINLIEAAESVGIHIPNLCYLKGMKGIGACRMCLVEANGKSMTACIMRTKDGMSVETDNERIRELRKFVVDMIVSMHPLDCMTCTKAGDCNLMKYAYDLEVRESSFSRKSFNFPVDNENPFIKRDPDYCVICGRCVRVCKEMGASVLDFIGRGVGSKVTTANDKPLQESGCTFCGTCVDACPVNALVEADRWRKGREWEYVKTSSVCLYCGSACDINVSTYNKDVAKIRAGAKEGASQNYICAIGRYGFDSLTSDNRALYPMIKTDGQLKPTSWDEALKAAAQKLKSSSAGIIATGSLVNEDALCLNEFAQKTGINNIDTTVSLYGDEASLIAGECDVESADLIVLTGLNPSQWTRVLPALDVIIRRKVDRKDKLVVINNEDIKLSDAAIITIKGDEADALKALAKALTDKSSASSSASGMDLAGAAVTEDINKIADLYKEAKNPIIITSPSLLEAAQNIALLKGSVVAVPFEANAKGVLLMGLNKKGMSYSDMINGNTNTLYAIGELPINKRPNTDFLIVQTSYMSDLAKEADIVLPVAAYLETSATIVDYSGKLKTLNKAVDPMDGIKTNIEVLSELAKLMGTQLNPIEASVIKAKSKKDFTPTAKPFTKRQELMQNPESLIESLDSVIINSSRLSWLKETENAVTA